jgi:hypothetical protein
MLKGGDEHGGDAQQDERDSDVVRKVGGGRACHGTGVLGRDETKEQTESCDDEAKPHDGETAPDPRQEGAFGCEEDAGIRQGVLSTYAA